jgi:predicted amidohydrolase
MNVACLQLAAPRGEPATERVRRVADEVRRLRGADLIVLPELWPGGYFDFDGYQEIAEEFPGPTVEAIGAAARDAGAHVAGGSVVERAPDGRLRNVAFLVDPAGELVLSYRKVHTFGYQSLEARLLDAGDRIDSATTDLGGVGLTTCYDLRFPELYRLLVDAGAEIVVVPAAWPRARTEHWLLLARARALENQVFLIACNGCGDDHGTALAGTSVVVDPWGDVVARAGEDEEILEAELDPGRVSSIRREFPALEDRRLAVHPEVLDRVH